MHCVVARGLFMLKLVISQCKMILHICNVYALHTNFLSSFFPQFLWLGSSFCFLISCLLVALVCHFIVTILQDLACLAIVWKPYTQDRELFLTLLSANASEIDMFIGRSIGEHVLLLVA
jgi:hypothetical protein